MTSLRVAPHDACFSSLGKTGRESGGGRLESGTNKEGVSPLADLSLTLIHQGLILPRRQRNARAEALIMRTFAQAIRRLYVTARAVLE